jgi:hypothetical protein
MREAAEEEYAQLYVQPSWLPGLEAHYTGQIKDTFGE